MLWHSERGQWNQCKVLFLEQTYLPENKRIFKLITINHRTIISQSCLSKYGKYHLSHFAAHQHRMKIIEFGSCISWRHQNNSVLALECEHFDSKQSDVKPKGNETRVFCCINRMKFPLQWPLTANCYWQFFNRLIVRKWNQQFSLISSLCYSLLTEVSKQSV